MTDTIRPDIIQSAARLFGEFGYERASLEQLAQMLGMRKGSLYYHIKSKEQLLYVIHKQLIDELTSNTQVAIAKESDPVMKLRAAMNVAMRLIADHRAEVSVFLNERRIFSTDRWRQIRDERDRYERMIDEVLEAGIRDGVYKEMPATLLGKGILGMINWSHQWFRADGTHSAEEIAQLFADLVLNGLLRDRDPE